MLLVVCFLLSTLPCWGASIISGSTRSYVNKPKALSSDSQLLYNWTFDGNDITWSSAATANVFARVGSNAVSTMVFISPAGDQVNQPLPGVIGQAFRFNGVNSSGTNKVDLSSVSLMTVSLWLWPDNVLTLNGDKMIIEGGSANWTLQTNSILIDTGDGTRKFTLGMRDPAVVANNHQDYFFNTNAFTASNTWYHCAFVFDNTTATGRIKAYVNAAAVPLTNSVNTKSSAGTFGNHQWTWGGRGSGGLIFVGRMDDIRIYTNELTLTQISEIYTSRFTFITP